MEFVEHIIAAADDVPRFISQPPLHAADVPLQGIVQAMVATIFSSMDGRQEGAAVGVFDPFGRVATSQSWAWMRSKSTPFSRRPTTFSIMFRLN